MGAALAVDWKEVRSASESGLEDEGLAKHYCITRDAIRQRRKREGWATPAAIEREKLIEEARRKGKGLSNSSVTGVTDTKAAALVALTLQERAEAYGLHVFGRVSQLATDGLDLLQAPDSWKTFAIADQIARRAAGMDKPEAAAVTVNLAMFSEDDSGWRDVSMP